MHWSGGGHVCGSSRSRRLDARIEVVQIECVAPPTDRIYSYAMNVLECANNKIDCQCLVECIGGNMNGKICHGKAIKLVAIEKRAEHAREYDESVTRYAKSVEFCGD